MGKSIPASTRLLREFGRITTEKLKNSKPTKPNSGNRLETPKSGGEIEKLKVKMEIQHKEDGIRRRFPLKDVVYDCTRRWFQDTLKEAKTGDTVMQVLVGQMYQKGYGITRDAEKGRYWISKASRGRSIVWKSSNKHPGYNGSDTDSDEQEDDVK